MEPDWISEFYGKIPENGNEKKQEGSTPPVQKNVPEKAAESKPIVPEIKTLTLDKDLEERFNAIMKLRDDVEKAIDEIYSKTGMDKTSVGNYLSNPQNFSSEQWAFVVSEKKRLEDQVWNIVGVQGKSVYEASVKRKKEHERKGKSLGGRKKWLPM